MSLGAVQSEYTGASYRYRRTTGVGEEFYGETSRAAQMTEDEGENQGKVIGLTMIPYGDTNKRYGMKAQYAAESTPDHPVIQVTSNYGGKQTVYKVDVNEVEPRNASQLEMFALLSYSDDKGISKGGSFGSYHQMKVYADNAQMNGYWEGNGDLDSFADVKYDWIAIMNRMTDDYSQAGIYSQYLKSQELVLTLSHFSIRHVDFDNLKIEDRSADTFSHYELNIPQNIMKAWLEVAGESGAGGISNDRFSHMTSVMIQRFSQYQDVTGNPIEAALQAAREALNALEYPLTFELEGVSEIQKELEEERGFYQSFIAKLEKLQESGNEAESTSDETTAVETVDLMQFIRERIAEIFVKVKNGDTEESFQIGNSSFTIKEWKDFLEKFDDIEDAIKELMKEEQEKRDEEAETPETPETISALVSESTRCSYPSSVPGQEDALYITWYTEEGIFCRKAGQSQGYEWSVRFESREDYLKVMEFLKRFNKEDDMRFAAHKDFWEHFLKDEIDI